MKKKIFKICILGALLTASFETNAKQDQDPDLIAGLHFEHWCIQNGIPTQDWTDEEYNQYLDVFLETDESIQLWDSLTNAYSTMVLTNK